MKLKLVDEKNFSEIVLSICAFALSKANKKEEEILQRRIKFIIKELTGTKERKE